MSDELKPCPFCGVEMKVEGPSALATGPGEVYVTCDCGAMGAGGKSLDDAIAAWNRRTVAAPIGAEALPPPDVHDIDGPMLGPNTAYSARKVREIIAPHVERIRVLERELAEAKLAPMCERKTDHIMQRDGYEKTGYVLKKSGERICVSDGGAVAWFTTDQWNWLMFNRDHVEFDWPKPLAHIDGRTAGTASEAAPDPVVEANRQLLLDRSRVGVKKYGVTLGAAGLPGRDLMQHALEEALDLANYLQTLLQTERSHAVPEDWKPVPRQYTDAQLAAGVAQYETVIGGAVSAESICGVIYDGMLAAAPSSLSGTEVAK